MPFSDAAFDTEIELYFRLTGHEFVLDIGPGEGKYGKLLRGARPDAKLIGVELDAGYVEEYRLRDLYDEVWVMDAGDLINDPNRVFDAVIIGDCIEHMRKSVGLDLLNFLVYRSKVILVKFPLQMLQNAWEGHASEAHLSVWSKHDFNGMDCLFVQRNFICLAVVRGYLNQTIDWIPPALTQCFGYASMAEFYASEPSRLSLADVASRRDTFCLSEIRHPSLQVPSIYLSMNCRPHSRPTASASACRSSKNRVNTGVIRQMTAKPSAKSSACANPAVRTSFSRGRPCGGSIATRLSISICGPTIRALWMKNSLSRLIYGKAQGMSPRPHWSGYPDNVWQIEIASSKPILTYRNSAQRNRTTKAKNMAAEKYLIVNADDFGQSPGVNRGIIEAHEHGIVTSTSLMTRWLASGEAALYAKEHPKLSLGLHLDLGEWIYSPDGWVPVYSVVPMHDDSAVKRELAHQLDVFRYLVGREPTHINSHQHVHMREPVRSIALRVCDGLGIPLRDLCPQINYFTKFYGQSAEGLPLPEKIGVDYLIEALSTLPRGLTVLICHPGDATDLNTVYQMERLAELKALCDSRVRAVIKDLGIELCSFNDWEDRKRISAS